MEIPVTEIQRMIEVSTATEVPVFEAYEDVMEYGIDLILESRYLDSDIEDLLIQSRDHYHEVYNTVFYPSGSRLDYEDRLYQLQILSTDLSERVAEALERY